ncbi:MAG: GspE/PulE family protein [Candidatus Nealsonbacteria bacterium]
MEKTGSGVKVSSHNIKNIAELRIKISQSQKENVTDLLNIILGGAVSLRASDLHIEPGKKTAKIRMRLDGLLQDVVEINNELYKTLLSRIKLMSKVKLNIANRPQDGRFSVSFASGKEETLIEVRSSTLPAEQGESIVLRILNPQSLVELEALGPRKDLLDLFKKELKKPNGMIIVTGPTGSGKTTTLYAFLKKITQPEIKIITIEDPIEYHLDGISQTQVNKNYSFASGLKSIMRQDPDVILVGEIRDTETVNTALQAALTGHLVLTTLHTNDASGTVSRLISLGAERANIGPAVNLAVAQRLVRTVCQKCSKLRKPSIEELQKIKKELKKVPSGLKIREAKGCKECNQTGYQGRIGLFEAFLVDDEMERFIATSPSIADLRDKAEKGGMISMRQDGFMKVVEGSTTIEEVERETGETK